MSDSRTVTIIGSYNVGLFLKGDRLPSLGETVIGREFHEGGGGKGSNQAVAARMMGAETRFVGRIGSDSYGRDAIAMYNRLGINTETVFVEPSVHTGISAILIDEHGHNLICVVPGANYRLTSGDVDEAEPVLADSYMVGFQLENRLDVVEYAIRKVHRLGVTTLLDPAPATQLPEDLYACLDIIKPNETEATTLSGIEVHDAASAALACKWFMAKGVRTAIVTLGAQGAVLGTDGKTQHFRAPVVDALDSTGAGDTFSGALMAALAADESMERAIQFASHAAALSVTRLGVIESIPRREEVLAFMEGS